MCAEALKATSIEQIVACDLLSTCGTVSSGATNLGLSNGDDRCEVLRTFTSEREATARLRDPSELQLHVLQFCTRAVEASKGCKLRDFEGIEQPYV